MGSIPRISVVIPTRDRPKEVARLLSMILGQSYLPLEVIVIDDSHESSTEWIVDSLLPKFRPVDVKLSYALGSRDGLTAARNLGVRLSKGDAILFLDDDIVLGKHLIGVLAAFLQDNPHALGVQPNILISNRKTVKHSLSEEFKDAIHKALGLAYHKENRLALRRSGMSIFLKKLTRTVSVQRLSGCCCCYRREVFNALSFDTNLKRWGYMEDLDFSYRVYSRKPRVLYAIPHARVVHKESEEARLSNVQSVYMGTIYWFYVFFKDFFRGSVVNLGAFLWALTGNLINNFGRAIFKRKIAWRKWAFIYLLRSYGMAFRNLKNILVRRLEFFNKSL